MQYFKFIILGYSFICSAQGLSSDHVENFNKLSKNLKAMVERDQERERQNFFYGHRNILGFRDFWDFEKNGSILTNTLEYLTKKELDNLKIGLNSKGFNAEEAALSNYIKNLNKVEVIRDGIKEVIAFDDVELSLDWANISKFLNPNMMNLEQMNKMWNHWQYTYAYNSQFGLDPDKNTKIVINQVTALLRNKIERFENEKWSNIQKSFANNTTSEAREKAQLIHQLAMLQCFFFYAEVLFEGFPDLSTDIRNILRKQKWDMVLSCIKVTNYDTTGRFRFYNKDIRMVQKVISTANKTFPKLQSRSHEPRSNVNQIALETFNFEISSIYAMLISFDYFIPRFYDNIIKVFNELDLKPQRIENSEWQIQDSILQETNYFYNLIAPWTEVINKRLEKN